MTMLLVCITLACCFWVAWLWGRETIRAVRELAAVRAEEARRRPVVTARSGHGQRRII